MACLWALPLIVALSVHTSYSSKPDTQFVFVDSREGNDELHCMEHGHDSVDRPCRTLQYVAGQATNISRPIKIVLLHPQSTFQISQAVVFTDVHHITIQGNNAVLSCGSESGLVLSMASDVTIQDLSVVGCGVEGSDSVKAAVLVKDCVSVSMKDVSITESNGIGLRILDTHGKVVITKCNITGNGNTSANEYRIGLYIQFSYCHVNRSKLQPTNYTIHDCTFVNNSGYVERSNLDTKEDFRVLRMGGAIGMQFRNNSCFNNVSILNSHFISNHARWGGGIFIRFKEVPYGNNIFVSESHFTANRAWQGGGGASVGYYSNDNNTLNKNRAIFSNVSFCRNRARYGGATIVYAKYSTIAAEPGGTVTFRNCTWLENIAYFSPAVDVSPYDLDILGTGYLPIPVFIDCCFHSNMVRQTERPHGTRNAAGAFLVTKFTVQFEGKVSFLNHSYTPLQVVTGNVAFQSGANVLFQSNKGIQGGAIAMYGFSSLRVNENSSFNFLNNTASDVGGAIFYQSLDQHDFVSARTCFIQHGTKTNRMSKNITMRFVGNNASRTGDSIFASSLYPCFFQYFTDLDEDKIIQVFQQIGSFDFDNDGNNKTIATEGNSFQFRHGNMGLQVIPGKRFTLPIGIRDELNHSISTLYRLDTPNISQVTSDRAYTADGNVQLFGNPCRNGSITLFSATFREIAIPIEVSFLHCPPGYFHYVSKGYTTSRCECAAYYEEHAYPGIVHCNNSLFSAYIEQDTWAGYPNTQHATPNELYTAACPFGFCAYELRSSGPLHLLPNESSYKVLDNYMCGKYRTGILCGSCDGDYSAYYHSRRYTCGTSQNCKFGLLFYILSELLPLTALFTTVIVFDIELTSGTLNGFVFFSQVLDTLYINARGAINFPPGVNELSTGYSIIYGLFNFEFFSINSLSFCLWERATVLDVIAFKYVTVAFALILVVALVTILRWCNCQSLSRLKRRLSTKDSVIHGLSAFLVMCYAQCTQISFRILTSVMLTGEGGHSGLQVSVYGGLPYLGRTHLRYALPALLCVVTIVALPPIVLLVFPLYNHVLAWCGLGESKTYRTISHFLRIDNLKPILDSFQGCFKDRLRFFAGLYFVYRIAILAAYSFCETILQFYFIAQLLLTIMIGLHATAQPYISRTHNAIDSLMFVTLALINGLTLYNFSHRFNTLDSKMVAVFWIQLVLIYLPLVLLAFYIISKVRARFPRFQMSPASPHDASTTRLSLRSLDGCADTERIPYQEFELSLHTRETSPPYTRPDFGI